MATTSFSGPLRITGKNLVAPSVTQTTNRSTAVTIHAPSGQIVTDATSLAAAADATFVVTNRYCKPSSVPVLAKSGGTANTSIAVVSDVTDGAFSIRLKNVSAATADTIASTINFIVFQGV